METGYFGRLFANINVLVDTRPLAGRDHGWGWESRGIGAYITPSQPPPSRGRCRIECFENFRPITKVPAAHRSPLKGEVKTYQSGGSLP